MDIPAPFNKVLYFLQQREYKVEMHGWTGDTKRYYQGVLTDKDGQKCHVKMADLKTDDFDDYRPDGGLIRTVWGHNIVQELPGLPFTVPTILHEPKQLNYGLDIPMVNVPVVWIVTTFNAEGQMVAAFPDVGDRTSADARRFTEACEAAAKTWSALCQIDCRRVIRDVNLPVVPECAPYQALGKIGGGLILRKQKIGCQRVINPVLSFMADRHLSALQGKCMQSELCFGLDAFELKNFFSPRERNTVTELIDTETWYWYDPYDMLAKMFIRLWANENRPDLGAKLLKIFDAHTDIEEQRLKKALRAKIQSGKQFDMVRRRQSLSSLQKRRDQLQKILDSDKVSILWENYPESFLHSC